MNQSKVWGPGRKWAAWTTVIAALGAACVLPCAAQTLSRGGWNCLVIQSDLRVVGWGRNGDGQLGDGTNVSRATPGMVSGTNRFVRIASGGDPDEPGHTLAIERNGSIWSWGNNSYGQLGYPTSGQPVLVPTQVTGLSGAFVEVSGGKIHSLALRVDGTVWAWGRNYYGQLGIGTNSDPTTPLQVVGVSNIVAISAGDEHSLALRSDGVVLAWGRNNSGQLGIGNTDNRNSAVVVSNLNSVLKVVGGRQCSFAVKSDGTVAAWGRNIYGSLGDGTQSERRSPVTVLNVTNIVDLSAGHHAVALQADGTVWTWGYGYSGEMGNGTSGAVTTPGRVTKLAGVLDVANGPHHSFALTRDGTVWTWGQNGHYQLGRTGGQSDFPLSVDGVVGKAQTHRAGHLLFVAADGSVWSSGQNGYGELGLGNNASRMTPAKNPNLLYVRSVTTGRGHSVALKWDGTVSAWGWNIHGQLGLGSAGDTNVPVMVSSLTNVMSLAAGAMHTIAVRSNGTVLAWGLNDSGQLGDSTATNRNIPTAITNLSGIKAVVAGELHSLAMTTGGVVYAWGRNASGQLGDGTQTNRFSPVIATGLTNATALAAGEGHSVVLKSNGTVVAFGDNRSGQLGDGTTVIRLTPTATASLSNVIAVAAGDAHTLALKSDGTVWAWGRNTSGQLGDGTTTMRTSPVQVSGLTNVLAIQAVGDSSMAILRSGGVMVFGSDLDGRLGTGAAQTLTQPLASQFKFYETFNPYLESTLALATNRYVRGDGTNPIWQSFVIPLDFQKGIRLPELGTSTNQSLWATRTQKPSPPGRHFSNGWGYSCINDNPIVSFGEGGGASRLFAGQTYKFGAYFGSHSWVGPLDARWHIVHKPIRILVYDKAGFAAGQTNVVPVATNEFSIPPLDVPSDSSLYPDYLGFVSNNCVAVNEAYGLRTVVQLVDGPKQVRSSAWGSVVFPPALGTNDTQVVFGNHPAFVLAHVATSTNYHYVVQGAGALYQYAGHTNQFGQWRDPMDPNNYYIAPMNWADNSDATNSSVGLVPGWESLYSLDFSLRPHNLPELISQTQFEGLPLPPGYAGRSLAALTNPPPPLTNAFNLTANSFTNLDDSPELRRHPVLDSFVTDLRNDPLALAQFVVNEIELADPLALADTAQNSPVINAGGVSRGALGAFLERQGSPLEQCALLVYFLRQAGVHAAYMFAPTGSVKMSDIELSHLLQMRIKGAVNYRGVAFTAESLISVNYPWVVADIGGRTVHIFPWLKDTQVMEGLALYDYMPTNHQTGYAVVKDYVKGSTNILGLSDVSDSLADLFPKLIEKNLRENHPGIALDDIGTRVVARKRSFARWEDLRRPLIVTNAGGWQMITNLTTGGSVIPRLTNVFDRVRIQVTPASNPTNILMDSGELRAADLHNRRMLIWTNGGNLQLSLAAYRTNITAVSNFTGDADLLKAQVMQASAGGSTNLQIKVILRRNIGLTNDVACLGLVERRVLTNLLTYRAGDLGAVCLNLGRVSQPMLQVHLDEAIRHQAQQTNGTWIPTEETEGAMAYLMGMSYYRGTSRFRETNERLHKVRILSKGAGGLASLRFSTAGGTNFIQPSVDMSFSDLAVAGSTSLRLDAGDDYYHVLRDFSWINIAALSAEEHMAIQRFFDAKSAVSTIRLLHLANQSAPPGEWGFHEVDSKNYSNLSGTPSYDSTMWASVASSVASGWAAEQGRAFITKAPLNLPGVYSGMAALIWTPDVGQALINQQLNGAQAGLLVWLKTTAPNGTYYLTLEGGVKKADGSGKPPPDAYARVVVNRVFQLFTLSMERSVDVYRMATLTPEQKKVVQFFQMDFGIQDSRLSAFVDQATKLVSDPVDVISGAFYVDAVDLSLPGPMPLQVRRNYSSQNLARTQLGWGWKVSYAPNLAWTTNAINEARLTAYEPDGGVISFRASAGDPNLFVAVADDNPALSHNNNESGAGQRMLSTMIERTNVSGLVTFTMRLADGSLRRYEERSYPIVSGTNTMSRTRPYLVRWQDSLGNAHTFEYGTNTVANDYGEVRRIQSSNGNFLLLRYDETGRIVEVRAGDGRTVGYEFDQFGDLVGVTRPDSSLIRYDYSHYTGSYTNTNNVVGTYLDSDHRLILETKPDGRQLKNEYDDDHRVVKQWATAGQDLSLVQNGTFIYVNYNTNSPFSITNAATNLLWGTTYVVDAYGKTNRYDYTNNLITRVVDALGNEILQHWYWSTNEAGGYPRALKSRRDERGLTTKYFYDVNGNVVTNEMSGTDLTGSGVTNAVTTTTYTNTFLVASVTDPLTNRVRYVYGDTNYSRLPTMVIRDVGTNPVSTNLMVYASATSLVTNGSQVFTNMAFGLVVTNVQAHGSPDAATNVHVSDGRGFLTQTTRRTGTADPDVVLHLLHNHRGELVEQRDAASRTNVFAYDELGRPRWTEVYDETGALRSWNLTYYNGNGEPTWSDGPRYNPEDYVWRDYDGMGRQVQEIRWRSQAKVDGSGVEALLGDYLYATAFKEYDLLGSLLRVIDQYGNYVRMTYDANGQMVSRSHYAVSNTMPMTIEWFGYEAGGLLTAHTNALGAVTRKIYTSTGKLMRQENADGTTNRWTYDLAGRVKREFLPNGTYWETTYDDLNRRVTRTFSADTNYTETKVFDRRGNLIVQTNLVGAAFTNVYDRLNRLKQSIGPATVNGVSTQQVTTVYYDAAGVWTTNANSLGERTVTKVDALGRTVRSLVLDAAGSVLRDSGTAYAADHHSVTVTNGSGSAAVAVTSYTDTFGKPVLTKFADGSYTLNTYDMVGNLLTSRDELGQVTQVAYDGMNRVTARMLPDGAQVAYSYDFLGNVTNRTMPGGLKWSGVFDTLGRKTAEQLSGGSLTNRIFGYTYYAGSHTNNAGLLQSVIDPRGLANTTTYDVLRRATNVAAVGPQAEHNQTTAYTYDRLSRATNLTQSTTGQASTTVKRWFDGYGQLTREQVWLGLDVVSDFSQGWSAAGRRTQLAQAGAGTGGTINYSHWADGLLKTVTNGPAGAFFGYDDAGRLNGRTNNWRSSFVVGRDSRGRVRTNAVVVDGITVMTESLAWRANSTLDDYSVARAGTGGWNENRDFIYDTRGHLTRETFQPNTGVTATNDFEFDANKLGVLVSLTSTGAVNAAWTAGGLDLLGRVGTENWTGPSNLLVRLAGRAAGAASNSVWLNGTLLTTNLVTNAYGGWLADVTLSPSNYTVTAEGAYPASVFGTRRATNTFTVEDRVGGVTNLYDAAGNVTNRVVPGQAQSLVWDAAGRLVRVASTSGGSTNWLWTAAYDALGRRLQTVHSPTGAAVTTITSYYDPLVEFGEVGVSVNGVRTWKVLGPDLNGSYGGLQGIGGLEGELREDGSGLGAVGDWFGNVAASVVGTQVVWSATRVSGYGPVAGYAAPLLGGESYVSQVSIWRTRRVDPTGFYWLGARYYEPGSGRFLSCDPFGHEASWDLYSYANGDPVNYLDPDGRLVRGANDASGKFMTGMKNLAKDGYYSASYGVSRMVYGQEAAEGWYGENWQGFKNAVGGLAQTLYDFSATTTYAGWSMVDNDFAYNSWGGSVGRTGSFMDALRGGEDETGAYQVGHGGLNAFLMMLPLKMGNTARASQISLVDAQEAMTQLVAREGAAGSETLTFFRGTTYYDALETVQNGAFSAERLAQRQATASYAQGLYLTSQEATASFYAELGGFQGRGGGPGMLRIDVPKAHFESLMDKYGIRYETPVARPPFPGQTETLIPPAALEEFNAIMKAKTN